MTLTQRLKLQGNPFEHYTAETEPNIAEYAVRPPYLQAISDRANGLSSFILFGERGAGKSATRITVFKEAWEKIYKSKSDDARSPFVVNLTDYSSIQEAFKKDRLKEKDILNLVAFVIIEQMFAWLSSLEDEDRQVYIEGLDPEETSLIYALLKGFYLSVPELDRQTSTSDALKLLNSAWTTKSALWSARRWGALSKVFATAINAFARKQADDDSIDIAGPAEALLKSLVGESPNAPRAILAKLVDFARAFGFSGVCVLVDKVDETPETSSSAESTARLIHPLLSHIQLLEVEGFSWLLFLWNNVQPHFNEKLPVRLDKIAHANITWDSVNLRSMLDKRLFYYSSGALDFSGVFCSSLDVDVVFKELSALSISSPRGLIKLMDIVFREHDARGGEAPERIDRITLDIAQDKYALETIGSWYARSPLQQVLRLGLTTFINKNVQTTFKIGDQGARNKIKGWEDIGLVKQNGTIPGELGGKPSYRYEIADARVERIIKRQLDDIVGVELGDGQEGSEEEVVATS